MLQVGADLCMGSLIKNGGGTIVSGGGYVAGRADLVERAVSPAAGLASSGARTWHPAVEFVARLAGVERRVCPTKRGRFAARRWRA